MLKKLYYMLISKSETLSKKEENVACQLLRVWDAACYQTGFALADPMVWYYTPWRKNIFCM